MTISRDAGVVGTPLEARAWREAQLRSLLAFGEPSLRPDGGAQWLDDSGNPDPSEPVQTWITGRMAHMYALADLLGVPGSGARADLALEGLHGLLHDAENGGWFCSVGPGGQTDGIKSAYAHTFVVLAAASGVAAGRPAAPALLDAALRTLDERFWEPEQQMHLDEWDRAWTRPNPYRGVNANMHSVEALLAAFTVTGDRVWLERATAVADRVVAWAAEREWRIPEHFDAVWTPLPELNADRPRDPFKPYGSTPGHGFEWSRLLLQVDAAWADAGSGSSASRLGAARAIFDRAAADGWDAEVGGFVYTVDWTGTPVEPRRFHWVAAEAVGAAEVLHRVTGEDRYGELAGQWWEYIRTFFVDVEKGSWHHELDTHNLPSSAVWNGKPDIYHAGQALLLADLPVTGSLAESIRRATA